MSGYNPLVLKWCNISFDSKTRNIAVHKYVNNTAAVATPLVWLIALVLEVEEEEEGAVGDDDDDDNDDDTLWTDDCGCFVVDSGLGRTK
jgi:hypothetical protein